LLEEAVAAARSLGPVAKAGAQLEAGLSLRELGSSEAGELLRAARDGYDKLGLSAAAALASLALARLGELEGLPQRLADLVAGARSPEVEEALAWIWPSLFELSVPEAETAIRSLLAELSWSLEALLAQGRLGLKDRQRLLEVLEGSGGFAPEGLLTRLGQDPDAALAARAAALVEEAASTPRAPTVRVTSFGYFTVQIGGQVLSDREWRTQKTRYLFAYLANPWGNLSHSEAVLEAFWSEDLMKARQAMYWSVSTARRVMREQADELSELIVRDGDNLSLATDVPHWHDVEEFERAYEAARAAEQEGRQQQALAAYREAVELYRGPYLEGCFFDWALERRREYARKCGEALAKLAGAAAARDDHDLTLEYAQRLLEQSPHAQDAHLLVMNTYLKTGRPELAIEQYRRCEKILRSEYDLEPVTELIEAYYRARLEMP
ncbi:MAG: bacterial transcriptional activator domain-containing protein, partial [Candidatus Eremiobacteraeota bacterium]|nr:bacterial transcriptional activator domain-containing protein [Candidatus Eremiobacteraeota bacterium]